MGKLRSDIEYFHHLSGDLRSIFWLDYIFYCFHPRLIPVVLLRLSMFFYRHQLGLLAKIFSMFNMLFFGIEISPKVHIGGGLFLPHTVGTVIGAERIGEMVTIMQGVTLGAKEPDVQFSAFTRPIIGSHVMIGSGAKIIGHVTVGDYAKIGANAVVLQDVPPYAIAVGVPARIVVRDSQREN